MNINLAVPPIPQALPQHVVAREITSFSNTCFWGCSPNPLITEPPTAAQLEMRIVNGELQLAHSVCPLPNLNENNAPPLAQRDVVQIFQPVTNLPTDCNICHDSILNLEAGPLLFHEAEKAKGVWHANHDACLRHYFTVPNNYGLPPKKCPTCRIPIDQIDETSAIEYFCTLNELEEKIVYFYRAQRLDAALPLTKRLLNNKQATAHQKIVAQLVQGIAIAQRDAERGIAILTSLIEQNKGTWAEERAGYLIALILGSQIAKTSNQEIIGELKNRIITLLERGKTLGPALLFWCSWHLDPRLMLAQIYHQRGQFKEAFDNLTIVVDDLRPEPVNRISKRDANYLLAQMYEEGQGVPIAPARVFEYYNKFISLSGPNDRNKRYWKAKYKIGQFHESGIPGTLHISLSEAFNAYHEIWSNRHNNPTIDEQLKIASGIGLCRLYFENREHDNCLQVAKELTEGLGPQASYHGLCFQARIHEKEGRKEDAYKLYQKTTESPDHRQEAINFLLSYYKDKGDINYYINWLKAKAYDEPDCGKKAKLYLELGRLRKITPQIATNHALEAFHYFCHVVNLQDIHNLPNEIINEARLEIGLHHLKAGNKTNNLKAADQFILIKLGGLPTDHFQVLAYFHLAETLQKENLSVYKGYELTNIFKHILAHDKATEEDKIRATECLSKLSQSSEKRKGDNASSSEEPTKKKKKK